MPMKEYDTILVKLSKGVGKLCPNCPGIPENIPISLLIRYMYSTGFDVQKGRVYGSSKGAKCVICRPSSENIQISYHAMNQSHLHRKHIIPPVQKANDFGACPRANYFGSK
jgi:hypothetical protein